MAYYIGLDAHSKTCTAVVMNAAGKVIKSERFSTSEKNLIDFVKTIGKPRHLVFEEQNLAHWLFLTFKDKVEEVVIAHPGHLPKQRGAKGDLRDANRLAEELRAGRITQVFHEDSKLWDLRTVVASYLDVTHDLVRTKNRYKSLLRSRGLPATGRGLYTDEDLLKKLSGYDHFVAVNTFEQIRAQQEIKDSYEDKFAEFAKKWPVIKNLGSIPGISNIRASIIAAIICSPARFADKHKLWAYARLVRYIDVSDGRIYGSRETA